MSIAASIRDALAAAVQAEPLPMSPIVVPTPVGLLTVDAVAPTGKPTLFVSIDQQELAHETRADTERRVTVLLLLRKASGLERSADLDALAGLLEVAEQRARSADLGDGWFHEESEIGTLLDLEDLRSLRLHTSSVRMVFTRTETT